MKNFYQIILLIGLLGFGVNGLAAETTKEAIAPNLGDMEINVNNLTTKFFKQGRAMAEIITWHDESAITILLDGRIVFRNAYFSNSGYNGSFIEDGAWSPNGSYFAFRILSSGGHMPYRTPVKIFQINENSPRLIDAESIIEKIPNISNIAVGPYKKQYLKWLSDTQLQVSVMSQDKESDSGMYSIDLDTLTAKKYSSLEAGDHNATISLSVLRGSPKRKAILDALREKIKQDQNLDVIFLVKYLKAKDGWAWIHTLPQSQDGRNHYEDVFALLNQNDGIWKVVEIPCSEEEDPDCITDPTYFSNLKKRFPDLSEEILPKE